MPALITHYLAASAAYNRLREEKIEVNRALYFWGAQGPDIFFFHKPLNGKKSIRRVGMLLHKTDPQQIFLAFRKYTELCDLRDLTDVYSYCYGFLSHLALDCNAHPYVYYFQDELAKQNGQKVNFMHHKIEHNLDVILLKKFENRSAATFRIGEALPRNRKGLKAAAKALAFMANEVIADYPVKSSDIYDALKDCKRYGRFLLSRRGRRRKFALWLEKKKDLGVSLSCFVRPAEPETDFDYTNAAHKRWISRGLAGGRPSSLDFNAIFDKGVEDSVYLAKRFKDCADHRQPLYFLQDCRFDNGSQKLEVRQWNA